MKRKIAFIAPLAAFVVLIAVAIVVVAGRITPLVAAERAIVNLGGDMTQRLEGTPFGAFPLLFDALEDGVVSISLDYSDRWSDLSFDIEFHSDEENRLWMLLMDFDVDGFALDLELHLDRHRVAVSSSILGDEFIGLTFATFRDDFAPFARMLGLSDWEVDEIADIVDFIYDTLNMPEPPGLEIWDPYAALLRQFILDGTVSSENTTINIRGQDVNVTRAEFHFTDDDMLWLLRDLMTTMSQDQNMDPFGMIDPWMWDDIFIGLDFLLDELDAFDGNMYLTMYIGPQNRLIWLVVDVNFEGYGHVFELHFGADFGTSVFDPWYFTLAGTTEGPNWNDPTRTDTDNFVVDFVWTYEESAGRFINTIEISATSENFWWNDWLQEFDQWESYDSGRFVSDWNSNTGVFVFSFVDDQWGDAFEFSGIYRLDSNGGFFLSIGPVDLGRETFSLEVSTRLGTNITPPQNFINFNEIPIDMLFELMMQF